MLPRTHLPSPLALLTLATGLVACEDPARSTTPSSSLAGATVQELVLQPDSIGLFEGWTLHGLPKLLATTNQDTTILPPTAATWSSSDPAIASVDSLGVIMALSAGTVSITATVGGVAETLAVTVKASVLPPVHEPIPSYLATPAAGSLYEIPVVIIRYLPTADGTNYDVSINPDHWGLGPVTLDEVRRNTELDDIRTKFTVEEGSKFRGYNDPSVLPSLGYRVVDYITAYEPLPPGKVKGIMSGWPLFQPDYQQIFERFNGRHYVEDLGVKEFWLWAPGVLPNYPSYDPSIHRPENFRAGEESNMSSPVTGDVSNSERDDSDLPVYSKSYVVYGQNARRTGTGAGHIHGHQLESMLSYVNEQQDGNTDLFWTKFTGQPPGHGRAGDTHHPPNTSVDYDYLNLNLVPSDIADWTPDGIGQWTPVNADTWGKHEYPWPEGARPEDTREAHWYIYWMQSMPGRGNTIPYGQTTMTNWWRFTGDWDGSIRARVGLHGGSWRVWITQFTVTPGIVAGCKSATGRITLSGPAPTGGARILLTARGPARVPGSVLVPAGATSVSFTIATRPVSRTQYPSVSATYGGTSWTTGPTVRPMQVASLSLSPNPAVGPNTVTGTVALECPAAPANIVVTLASSNPKVSKPKVGSITIPAGTRRKTFLVTTANVSSTRSATITATANGGSKSSVLTVK